MAFSYLYNKQVYPADLFTAVSDGLATPLYIDYDVKTFDIAIWFENALTVPQHSALTDIVNNIIYVDKSAYATFSFVTTTEEQVTSLTANTVESQYTNAGSLSASTIFSGSTDLYNIFLTTNDGNDITRVQPGTNITTGGTANNPIINLTASPSVNNISFSGTATGGNVHATSISGGTLFSGSTNLYDIFSTGTPGGASTYVQNGTNTYTGGTLYAPTVNVSALTINTLVASGSSQLAEVTATSLSAITFSAGTINSGSTNLYSIFAPFGGGGGPTTYVQPGTNITTGGTATNPIINVVDSPSFDSLTASGTGVFNILSATSISASSLSMLGNKITDLANPTTANDAVNKTYVDNLSFGLIWQQPVQLINIIGDSAVPITTGLTNDAYVINTGGNTGVWSTFAVGDLVQLQATGWTFIKSLVVSDRVGVSFKSASIPFNSFLGKNDYISEITGGTPGAYTWSFTAPVNNYALFVNNSNAYYNGVSYTYSSGLTQWVQLDSSVNYTFGDGLSVLGNNIRAVYTTGFTYNNANIVSLSQNYGGPEFSVTINQMTGLTIDGGLTSTTASITTLSAGTLFSGSTNLYSIFQTIGSIEQDPYLNLSGGTVTGNTIFTQGLTATTFSANTINVLGQVTGADGATFTRLSGTTIFVGNSTTGGTVQAEKELVLQQTGDTFGPSILRLRNRNGENGAIYETTDPTVTLVDFIFKTAVNQRNIRYEARSGSAFLTAPEFEFGQATNPTLVVDDSSVLVRGSGGTRTTSLSATTLSGGTIFSGNTNLQTYFNTINAQLGTKANCSGETFTGQVNAPILSATTLSATTSVFISSIKFPVSPVSGYILTSDASGNASWAASPTPGSGTTKLDMQSVSNQATTPTATGALVDVAGMTLTTKNLGSSATTYYVNFTGNFSNSSNAGNSTFRIVKNGVQISGALTNLTNGGASMTNSNRTVSIAVDVTGVTNGDIIKVQMSASTGTVTARNKSLSIIGTLNSSLV